VCDWPGVRDGTDTVAIAASPASTDPSADRYNRVVEAAAVSYRPFVVVTTKFVGVAEVGGEGDSRVAGAGMSCRPAYSTSARRLRDIER
jgi:hypothetical protein